ncbi:MAG: Crp/Fnr family transcriptional regulator [Oscillatoriaceae bacterium SKW80]|nr:Crp/Fnr family transcriptional regulator [Oscillatoriaceae bacterium SKYG93]MCX8119472.1 Crp/Fnr family transcriptional regulator [Oscillatoriaceae bacterium SKW80]MDW8454938.1 Crp/Fnr family transcriptional regulator [Oscillatoriaceae cyanobacterium SKYGB_i_bin93]
MLPTNLLDTLAAIALKQKYTKGEIIFWQGDEGRGFLLSFLAKSKFSNSPQKEKNRYCNFLTLGEVPAFDGQCFPASAAAAETTELLFFLRAAFLQLLQQHPTLALKMLGYFRQPLAPLRNEKVVELDTSKTQLAGFLGTIPETLSRVFSRMAAEGLIDNEGS